MELPPTMDQDQSAPAIGHLLWQEPLQHSQVAQFPVMHGQQSDGCTRQPAVFCESFQAVHQNPLDSSGADGLPTAQQRGTSDASAMPMGAFHNSAGGCAPQHPVPTGFLPIMSFDSPSEPQALAGQQGWLGHPQGTPGFTVGTHQGRGTVWMGSSSGVMGLQMGFPSQIPLGSQTLLDSGAAGQPGNVPPAPNDSIANSFSVIAKPVGRAHRKRAPSSRGQTPGEGSIDNTEKPTPKRVRKRPQPKPEPPKDPTSLPKDESCLENPMEVPTTLPASRGEPLQKVIFITAKGQMQGSTPARLRSAGGGVEVMAKMYLHRKKLAWRAEVLINGTKRQKSFSCKLYGCERARMMCEWARNFVLRTGRLPTDEETCASLAVLLQAPLPSERKGDTVSALDIQYWLHCYPPEAPRLVYRPLTEERDAAASFFSPSTPQDIEGTGTSHEFPAHGGGDLVGTQDQQGQEIEPQSTLQGQTGVVSHPPFCKYFLTQGHAGSPYVANYDTSTVQGILEPSAAEGAYGAVGASAATAQEPSFCRSFKEQEAALYCVFPELACLSRLAKPKVRGKRQNVGKKPHSGVRGMYFQQGSWKVKYQGAKEANAKIFPFAQGDLKEMVKQHVLARIFLRQVIEKNRQLHDSDGDGLSDPEPEWLKKAESQKFVLSSDTASRAGESPGTNSSGLSPPQREARRRVVLKSMKRPDAVQPPASGGYDDQRGTIGKEGDKVEEDSLFLEAAAQTLSSSCPAPCSLQVETPTVHSASPVEQCQSFGRSEMLRQLSAWRLPTKAISEDEYIASVKRQAQQQVTFDVPATANSGQAAHQPGSKSSPNGYSMPNSSDVFCGDTPLNVQEDSYRMPPAFRDLPSAGRNCTAFSQPLQTDSGTVNKELMGSVDRECESLSIRQANLCLTVETLLCTTDSSTIPSPPNLRGIVGSQVDKECPFAGNLSSGTGGDWTAFQSRSAERETSDSDASTEEDSSPTTRYAEAMIANCSAADMPLSSYDAMKLHIKPSMSYSCRNDVDLGPTELPPFAANCVGELDRPLHQSSGYKESKATISSLRRT